MTKLRDKLAWVASDDSQGEAAHAGPYAIEESRPSYSIDSKDSKSFKGGVVKETTYQVRFHEDWLDKSIKSLENELKEIMKDLVEEAREDYQEVDMARVHVDHPNLNHAIVVPPRRLGDLNPEVIMEAIENVLQSEENLTLSEAFTVQVGVARMGQGARGE